MKNDITAHSKGTQFQSGEKAVKSGRKGGIRSGEVKAEKKTMRQTMETALQTKNTEGLTLMQAGVEATIRRWIKTGDAQALNAIRDLIGEKPKDEVQLNGDGLRKVNIVFATPKREPGQDPAIIGDYTRKTETE